MARLIDITGQRFHRLVVQLRSHRRGHGWYWSCLCDCGRAVLVTSANLRSGRQKSCGCLHDEVARSHYTHRATIGYIRTREYRSWSNAKTRCTNPRAINFADYGGRGIAMCPEWSASFETFLRDMGPCPPGHSIDRFPDSDGPYAPGNCRWATSVQQVTNRRNTRRFECDGGMFTIAELARAYGVQYSPLWTRLTNGQSAAEAIAGIRRHT